MSKFMIIKTEFTDGEILKQALGEIGCKYEEGKNLTLRNFIGQPLNTRHDYMIVVRRKHVGVASNDVAFYKKEDGTSGATISEFDVGMKNLLPKLRQKYTELKVKKEAIAKGFKIISEEKMKDGTIKLVARKWL